MLLKTHMLQPFVMAGTVAVLTTFPLAAQAGAGGSCSDGGSVGVVDALGLRAISCTDCTIYTDEANPENARWTFRSEPVVMGVDDIGPADGFVRPGDAIVLVDGYLITTKEGSRRFSAIKPGVPVEVGLRRGGPGADVRTVTLVPWEPCDTRSTRYSSDTMRAVGRRFGLTQPRVVARVLQAESLASLPPVPTMPRWRASGWLGLSLSCSDCGIYQRGRDQTPEWRFSSPPLIDQVERGGPAYRAGLRAGDRIMRIDRKEITSKDAGRRFGALKPGDNVLIRVERDGNKNFAVRIRAGTDPTIQIRRALTYRLATAKRGRDETIRYTGGLGNTLIEVTGAPVTVTQSEKEIVIQSGDIMVRIRKDK